MAKLKMTGVALLAACVLGGGALVAADGPGPVEDSQGADGRLRAVEEKLDRLLGSLKLPMQPPGPGLPNAATPVARSTGGGPSPRSGEVEAPSRNGAGPLRPVAGGRAAETVTMTRVAEDGTLSDELWSADEAGNPVRLMESRRRPGISPVLSASPVVMRDGKAVKEAVHRDGTAWRRVYAPRPSGKGWVLEEVSRRAPGGKWEVVTDARPEDDLEQRLTRVERKLDRALGAPGRPAPARRENRGAGRRD